jgi:hypothetical protein
MGGAINDDGNNVGVIEVYNDESGALLPLGGKNNQRERRDDKREERV